MHVFCFISFSHPRQGGHEEGEDGKKRRRLPLPERVGRAMQHAGVAVTVTSVTDVFAFGVGTVTVSRWARA